MFSSSLSTHTCPAFRDITFGEVIFRVKGESSPAAAPVPVPRSYAPAPDTYEPRHSLPPSVAPSNPPSRDPRVSYEASRRPVAAPLDNYIHREEVYQTPRHNEYDPAVAEAAPPKPIDTQQLANLLRLLQPQGTATFDPAQSSVRTEPRAYGTDQPTINSLSSQASQDTQELVAKQLSLQREAQSQPTDPRLRH
jgi:hypothetical protein